MPGSWIQHLCNYVWPVRPRTRSASVLGRWGTQGGDQFPGQGRGGRVNPSEGNLGDGPSEEERDWWGPGGGFASAAHVFLNIYMHLSG